LEQLAAMQEALIGEVLAPLPAGSALEQAVTAGVERERARLESAIAEQSQRKAAWESQRDELARELKHRAPYPSLVECVKAQDRRHQIRQSSSAISEALVNYLKQWLDPGVLLRLLHPADKTP
jgi:hypothetical protein